jgi:hypothetical protein
VFSSAYLKWLFPTTHLYFVRLEPHQPLLPLHHFLFPRFKISQPFLNCSNFPKMSISDVVRSSRDIQDSRKSPNGVHRLQLDTRGISLWKHGAKVSNENGNRYLARHRHLKREGGWIWKLEGLSRKHMERKRADYIPPSMCARRSATAVINQCWH